MYKIIYLVDSSTDEDEESDDEYSSFHPLNSTAQLKSSADVRKVLDILGISVPDSKPSLDPQVVSCLLCSFI